MRQVSALFICLVSLCFGWQQQSTVDRFGRSLLVLSQHLWKTPLTDPDMSAEGVFHPSERLAAFLLALNSAAAFNPGAPRASLVPEPMIYSSCPEVSYEWNWKRDSRPERFLSKIDSAGFRRVCCPDHPLKSTTSSKYAVTMRSAPFPREAIVLRRPWDAIARHQFPVCCDLDGIGSRGISFEVELDDGVIEPITLVSVDDPAKIAADLASRHALSADESSALEAQMMEVWEMANTSLLPVYLGPMCDEDQVRNCIASAEYGTKLLLEVADSVVDVGGRGLFIRCLVDVEAESATLVKGTPICGCAQGKMSVEANEESERTVLFEFSGLDQGVFFENELRTVGDLLADDSVEAIAGHLAIRDNSSGKFIDITPDETYNGPRYFVVDDIQPEPLNLQTFGQMANDLAIRGFSSKADTDDNAANVDALDHKDVLGETHTRDEERQALYEQASKAFNVLGLLFEIKRDEQQPSILVPSHPILVLTRTVTFGNDMPMELGLSYGWSFWEGSSATIAGVR